MGCKFSLKRVFLVASLSLAGLFGISSILVNKQVNDSPAAKEAKAEVSSYIYFTRVSTFANDIEIGDLNAYFNNQSDQGSYGKLMKNIQIGDIITIRGDMSLKIIKIAVPSGATQVRFNRQSNSDGQWWTQTDMQDLPLTTDPNKMFVLNSNRGNGGWSPYSNQKGFWTSFEGETTDWKTTEGCDTDTLYYVPNKSWWENEYDNQRCWPSISITFATGASYNAQAYCVTTPSPSFTSVEARQYVFCFTNVPLKKVTSMTFNHRVYSSKWFTYNTVTSDQWFTDNKEHKANVFGMSTNGDSPGSGYAGTTWYYCTANKEAKAYLAGTFSMHKKIDWPNDGTGYVPDPTDHNSLTKESANTYSKTLFVTPGDFFQFYFYTYMNNDGANISKRSYETRVGPVNYLANDVTVCDNNGTDITTKGESKTDYITSEGNAYKFVKGGRVKIVRYGNSTSSHSFEVWFLDNEEASDYYLVGDGSFVTGTTKWSTLSGVRMSKDDNNQGYLYHQFLKEGDVFQIKDSSQSSDKGWYGWSYNRASGTDTSNVRTAYYDFLDNGVWKNYNDGNGDTTTDGKHMYYTYEGAYHMWNSYIWQNDDTSKNRWNQNSGQPQTQLYQFTNGRYISDGVVADRIEFKGDDSWSARGAQTITSNGNIVVGTTGYYDIYISSSSNEIFIRYVDSFVPGDALYLDINGKDIFVDGTYQVFAYFWNGSGNQKVEFYLMHENWLGEGKENNVYEVIIPEITSANPHPTQVLFYTSTSKDGGWNAQTRDLGFSDASGSCKGYNVFGLNNVDMKSDCNWYKYLTNYERAEYYGTYFNKEVICDGGITIPGNWSEVETEYLHMCPMARSIVKKTVANKDGTEVEKAVSKYDDIVFRRKYDDHDDFMNRNDNDETSGSYYKGTLPKSVNRFSPYSLFGDGDSNSLILIIVISSVSILSITGLSILLIKKRKSQ